MSLTELSFEELKQELIDELKQQPTGALATSDGEDVTARFMGLFSDGLTIYCFAFQTSRKCRQISVNPNVSIATGNLQIDGTATLGHPLDEENTRFVEIYKERMPEYFKIAESVHFPKKSERVIEITPRRISKFNNGNFDILNIPKEKAHKIEFFSAYTAPEYHE